MQLQLVSILIIAGIILEAYSPLGNPGRVSGTKATEPVVMEDPVIKEIAERLNTSPAQVSCLRIAYNTKY